MARLAVTEGATPQTVDGSPFQEAPSTAAAVPLPRRGGKGSGFAAITYRLRCKRITDHPARGVDYIRACGAITYRPRGGRITYSPVGADLEAGNTKTNARALCAPARYL